MMWLSLISYLLVFRHNAKNIVDKCFMSTKCDGYDQRFPLNHKENQYDFEKQFNKKSLLSKLKNNDTNIHEKVKYLEDPNTPKPVNITNGGLLNEWTPWGIMGSSWEF